ncbi:MAG TPA: MBL fold metallo-hydrolase [Gemmatimonadaceae bacterium]|nr:MBL fold metallo-hydrolase [Gemmatimonadaceae bacterium]
MIRVDRTGELTRIWLSSWRSRTMGYGVHVFLWRGVLIDTGFPAARKDVAGALEELRPSGVILTHGHEDHAGNIGTVAARNIPLWHSPLTPAVIRANGEMAAYRRFTWGRMPLDESPGSTFDPAPLTVLHTPGHSADHHVVWDPERETLFAADLFLGTKVRVARPLEDPRALVNSLRQVAALRPREMWDAHRGSIPDPSNALIAKADWIDALIERVISRIRAGEEDERIAQRELGRPTAVDRISFGDLSRVNLVRAIRRTATTAA